MPRCRRILSGARSVKPRAASRGPGSSRGTERR
jgi:hypothetical protein